MSRRRYMCKVNNSTEKTLLLLHAEDFVDSSINNFAISNSGVVLNNNGKFEKCFYMPNNALLRIDSLILPKSGFSFDCWVKVSSYSASIQTIATNGYGSIDVGLFNGKLRIVKEYVAEVGTSTVNFPLNVWTHVYVDITNGSAKAYINGSKVIDASCSLDAGVGLMIGGHKSSLSEGGQAWSLNGYIDEFRISNVARWTSNFTPPTKPY